MTTVRNVKETEVWNLWVEVHFGENNYIPHCPCHHIEIATDSPGFFYYKELRFKTLKSNESAYTCNRKVELHFAYKYAHLQVFKRGMEEVVSTFFFFLTLMGQKQNNEIEQKEKEPK